MGGAPAPDSELPVLQGKLEAILGVGRLSVEAG